MSLGDGFLSENHFCGIGIALIGSNFRKNQPHSWPSRKKTLAAVTIDTLLLFLNGLFRSFEPGRGVCSGAYDPRRSSYLPQQQNPQLARGSTVRGSDFMMFVGQPAPDLDQHYESGLETEKKRGRSGKVQ
jgi:hypothetical protein